MIVTIVAAALATQPLAATPPHQHLPVALGPVALGPVALGPAAQSADEATVRSVLSQYKAAIDGAFPRKAGQLFNLLKARLAAPTC